ncbi:MAG TPA: reverse transcriptase domain-containing protein [Terriglobia bacterium]|nr:reverse transcriptase domain-containing protein [Terriglobia bacterium]
MTDLLEATGMAEAPAAVLAAQLDYGGAWERVRKKAGMAGVDGVTTSRFGGSAESTLKDLEFDLAGGRYQPLPLRMAQIEKKSGGSARLLMVPTVVDRIAQTAAAQWLGMKWNTSFDRASFGYRPGMGVRDALRRLHELRDSGFIWVLDADIRSFFDSIDHELLLEKLARCLGQTSPIRGWVESWIRTSVWDGVALLQVTHGVPQGSPLSPILSNFYLHELDVRLRSSKIQFIRYADDFLVLARTPFDLAESRSVVDGVLKDLRLSLNEEKTRTVTFDKCFRFLGAEMQSDQILLPFEKKKEAFGPADVSPIMPPGLLRAFRSGDLKAAKSLIWTGIRETAAQHQTQSSPTSSGKACEALRGGQTPVSMKLLSGR